MNILGISAFYHDDAAALVRDGEIIATAQEERFMLKKHDSCLFYDFGDIFNAEKGTVFKDFCHFKDTNYANFLIAEKIDEIIKEKNLIN